MIGLGSTGDAVARIQNALRAAGHELVADGDFGIMTEAAVKQFQAAHGLAIVGYVGPKTSALLDGVLALVPDAAKLPAPLASVLSVAPHLATMRAITGTKEVPGAADSPVILGWSSVIAHAFPDLAKYAMTYEHDATPWCGHGMGYCFALHALRPPDEYMWALNWRKAPMVMVPVDKPFVGAVFTGTRSGGGHVSIVEGWTHDHWIIRGGNQGDMVNVASRLMDTNDRLSWPAALPMPKPDWRPPITSAAAGGKEA